MIVYFGSFGCGGEKDGGEHDGSTSIIIDSAVNLGDIVCIIVGSEKVYMIYTNNSDTTSQFLYL